MPEFSKLVITENGRKLISKIIMGTENIKFTKVSVSSTGYTEEQLATLTALENVEQTSLVSKVTRTDSFVMKVEAAFSNVDLTEGYNLNTLGLYATDPDEGEILYAVTREKSGNCYMPAYNGTTVTAAYIQLFTSVGNADNISMEINPGAYATIGDIQALEKEVADIKEILKTMPTPENTTVIFSEAPKRENISSGETLSVIFGKIRKFFADLKTVAFTGSYTDLSNRPTKVSAFENDEGYLTSHQDISGKLDKTGDASNTTNTFSAASARANLFSGEKLSVSLGKIMKFFADLKTVAFTGSYNDLSNRPTIQNNLTSTSTTDSLSANQGRLLASGYARDNTKLPTAGGTVKGGILFNPDGNNNYGFADFYCGGVNMLSLFCKEDGAYLRANKKNLWLHVKNGADGVGVQFISESGVRTFAPIFASAFTVNSSKRYKENINTMTEERARSLLNIEVVTYDYIKNVVSEAERFDRAGVIAEDTEDVIKEAVFYKDIDGRKVPDGVDYSRFVPYLIRMVQLQQSELESLKEKAAAME